MSRMRTSSASFSWARAPIRRARSSDVKRPQCSPQSGLIEAARLDQGGDGRRDEVVEGVAAPDRSRGDRMWVDLEEMDALRARKLLEHGFQPSPWKAGPSADAELGELEDPARLRPLPEVAELVGPEDEERVVEVLRWEQLDRARVRI